MGWFGSARLRTVQRDKDTTMKLELHISDLSLEVLQRGNTACKVQGANGAYQWEVYQVEPYNLYEQRGGYKTAGSARRWGLKARERLIRQYRLR